MFPAKNYLYSLSFLPGILAIVGNLFGGFWTLGNLFLMPILNLCDRIIDYKDKQTQEDDHGITDAILIILVVLHSLAIFSLIYAAKVEILSGWWLVAATISTGINSGSSATVAAHELIHRRTFLRFLGLWNLFLVNYGAYFVEHIQGHHKNVATNLDPSTAKYNESFYHFLYRAAPVQFQDALQIEAKKLERKGKFGYGLQNLVVTLCLMKIALLIAIYFGFGLNALLAFLAQSMIARIIHESITYSQHYGLERPVGERIGAAHSWQGNSWAGEYFLLGLIRHSDHHNKVARSYPQLVSLEESPNLPHGYFAAFLLIFLPPLWFKMANKELQKLKTSSEIVALK